MRNLPLADYIALSIVSYSRYGTISLHGFMQINARFWCLTLELTILGQRKKKVRSIDGITWPENLPWEVSQDCGHGDDVMMTSYCTTDIKQAFNILT